MNILYTDDTICAIATAQGGAIGTIRVSGKEAITITDKIFTPVSGAPLSERKPYTLTFGHITNEGGEIVDEVLVSLFRGPHSYTGEDSTEISCHGSSYVLQQVMQLLIKNGCRAAGPGEFTQRAFLNGKMDLSQAEAVADLIASTSASTHRMAMNQMRGGFSRELSALREKLLHLTSLMELELDFSDHEELEFADRSELSEIASQVETVIKGLVNSFSVGNAIKNGIPVAIIGETNAGKSTLLNALLNEERAIVSDIHGTTRDVIEDTMNIDGILFRFIDTAGIRETTDTIESLGIERSFQKLDQASIVLWVIDSTEAKVQIDALKDKVIPRCEGKKLILVMNKCDMVSDTITMSECLKDLHGVTIINPVSTSEGSGMNYEVISIAAKQRKGIAELQNLLVKAAALPEVTQNDVVVSNVRHYEAECLFHLAEIVGGEITNDEVLGNIFKNFCIGK